MEPTVIVGICGTCGSSVLPDTHYASSQMNTIFARVPAPTPFLICASCFNGLVEMELKYRLMKDPQFLLEYRKARLAEYFPKSLYGARRAHRMKELLMLQPMGPRVLVKRIDAPRPTSTLIIPDTVDGEKSCYAIVLAIGNKITEDIKVADTVILTAYCGSPVTVELADEMLEAIIVMESDILAVIED